MSALGVGQVIIPDTVTPVQVVPARASRVALRLRCLTTNAFYVGPDNTVSEATGFASDVLPGYLGTTLQVDTSGAVFVLGTTAGEAIQYMELY